MKILFVSSEGLPYSKTGGLGGRGEGAAQGAAEMGHEVAVLLPRYRGNKITQSGFERHRGAGRQTPLSRDRRRRAGRGRPLFLRGRSANFSTAHSSTATRRGDYPDNAERFAEFSRVAIEFMKRVWLPDVIHCHDWQSALVPVLLRTQHANDPVVRVAAGGLHDSQSRLPGTVSARRCAASDCPTSFHAWTRWNFTAR